MKIVLHIGSPKTGTTAAQSWLMRNRAELARRGVYSPGDLCGEHHHAFALMFQPFDPDHFAPRLNEIGSKAEFDALASAVSCTVEREAQAARRAGAHAFLVSSEHLQIALDRPQRLSALKAWLAPRFDEVTILMTVRPQAEAVLSLASSAARAGERITSAWFEPRAHFKNLFDFEAVRALWADAFGERSVVVAPRRRGESFSSILQPLFPEASLHGLDPEDRENTALSLEAVRLFNAMGMGRRLPAHEAMMLTSGLDRLLPAGQSLAIGPDRAARLQGLFEDSNARLLRAAPNLHPADLAPGPDMMSRPSNVEQLDTDIDWSDQLEALTAHFGAVLDEERARRRALKAEFERSTSWRITAPVRQLGRWMHGLTSRAG